MAGGLNPAEDSSVMKNEDAVAIQKLLTSTSKNHQRGNNNTNGKPHQKQAIESNQLIRYTATRGQARSSNFFKSSKHHNHNQHQKHPDQQSNSSRYMNMNKSSGSQSKKRSTSRIDYALLNNATMHAKIDDEENENCGEDDTTKKNKTQSKEANPFARVGSNRNNALPRVHHTNMHD